MHISKAIKMTVFMALGWPVFPLNGATLEQVHNTAQSTLPEYLEYLTLPNVTTQSTADIAKVASWTKQHFDAHGFNAELLPDGDTPMVFASKMSTLPDVPTILFYAHMDGQAVDPKEWDQPSPWQPVLRATAGKQAPLALSRLNQEINPEWRIYARSAADDKAPIMMLMAAIDVLRKYQEKPAINIKILIDSHEEGGPPTLIDVINDNKDKLDADAVVMLDGPMHPSNQPTLVFGHRGVAFFRLTVFGPANDSHSGHYGNVAPNPAFGLARLLTAMKDANGNVTIPEYYASSQFSDSELAAMDKVQIDEDTLMKRLGIAKKETVGKNYHRAINYPSLNINGMSAASTQTIRTIIPASATVTVDIRTTVKAPGQRQLELVRKFIEKQGYHLVDHDPTAEERQKYPLLARFDSNPGAPALQTPLTADIGEWANTAIQKVHDTSPIVIPMMGGTVPTRPLVEGLQVPVILLPLVNADNNQHAANENLRLGNYLDGVATLYGLMTTPYIIN